MKKILALNASPHETGCTAALIHGILDSCKKQDADIKYYYLNGMNIKACQACRDCRTRNKCIVQDDMNKIFDEIQNADAVIFGTPVYIWQMSAQLKTVIDRMQPFLTLERTSLLKPGKKVLLAATQGVEDVSKFRDYFEYTGKSLIDIFNFMEYKILIAGGTRAAEDVLKQNDILKKADEMGSWLTE